MYLDGGYSAPSPEALSMTSGTFSRSTYSRAATTAAEHEPPFSRNTLSCSVSFLTAATRSLALQRSSSITSSIWRPLMPPSLLTLSLIHI